MSRKKLIWIIASVVIVAGLFLALNRGGRTPTVETAKHSSSAPAKDESQDSTEVIRSSKSESLSPVLGAGGKAVDKSGAKKDFFAYRLSNTKKTAGQLLRDDNAIILENAHIETGKPLGFAIPEKLRSVGDPGAYIVQSRGAVDGAFRAALAEAGATIVSYIPNNAFLVRADESAAKQLAANPEMRSVLPYEPVYKLKSPLLELGMDDKPLPGGSRLNLLVFADAYATVKAHLEKSGWNTLSEDVSPFGNVLTVEPQGDWTKIATVAGVQILELAAPRAPANDLTRARLNVATNSTAQTNYFNLTGSNILISINDSGVDQTHPDLMGRVLANSAAALIDTDGHGTHVAGTIMGSGAMWMTATNVRGSPVMGTNGTRGMAYQARLFSQDIGFGLGSTPDRTLQEATATTNALISNNSWVYQGNNTYGLASASFDAAVRDSLSGVTGSQPVLYVFAAGNNGDGGDNGLSGDPGSVLAPGTAKNVITVGAIELPRDITNVVTKITDGNTNKTTPWKDMTSSANQVAWFSSRGNVGIGTEGDFGRFKPDVVAPGTFVVSTRSAQWDETAYYNPTSHSFAVFQNQTITNNSFRNYSLFLPDNAVGFTIAVFANEFSPETFPDIPIYVRRDAFPNPLNTAEVIRTNIVNVPSDIAAGPGPDVGQNWYYSIGNNSGQNVNLSIFTDVITTNELGDYYTVLSNLNNSITGTNQQPPHYYRYESGTSMAAPAVSGMLALMQEMLEVRLGKRPSPALLKALLINGARNVGNLYDMQVQSSINHQGWGLPRLNNSLPPAISNAFNLNPGDIGSIKLVDQSPDSALATGFSQTRNITLSAAGRNLPLRITLAWTDPAGNPVAGVKLVNDLDLVVTNLDSGEIYLGNDIGGSSTFTFPWDTNTPPNIDSVNNVENVFIAPPHGTNISITVVGRRVNVNAVTANTNDIVQDYVLVISSGNGESTNAITMSATTAINGVNSASLTVVTNNISSTTFSSGTLIGQRVGANSPLLVSTNGTTNQWRFYVMTNTTTFTNATFLVSQQTEISTPRIGVFSSTTENSGRRYADIDMYVSTDPAIVAMDPLAIANSFKSQSRNDVSGDEFVIFSNSTPNLVYYIGVKSEDQMSAEYEFYGIFSLLPLGDEENGFVRAYPMLGFDIPDGSPSRPGGTRFVAITRASLTGSPESIRRLIVTNNITHENFGDLIGVVDHNSRQVVLNNHRSLLSPPSPPSPGPYPFLYEDSGEGDILGAIIPDGPGTFETFVGEAPGGTWYFTYSDDALSQTGRVNEVRIRIDRQVEDNNSSTNTVGANSWKYFSRNISIEATNLTICISNITPSPLPLQVYIRKDRRPTQTSFDYTFTVNPSGCLTIDKSDLPPLTSGRYFIGVFNGNSTPQTFIYSATVLLGVTPTPLPFSSIGGQRLLDDAVTNLTTFITETQQIGQVEVGLRLDHPRVSDLAVTLISPSGKRVLLVENRGGLSTNGFGSSLTVTNFVPVAANGGATGQTNFIPTGATVGTVTIDYDFFNVADQMTVYYEGVQLFNSGMTNGARRVTLNYGPGVSADIEVRMNEFGNTNTSTLWGYTVSSYNTANAYLVFTDNTNKTTTPVKFALPPFMGTLGTSSSISEFEPPILAGDYNTVSNATPDGWNLITTNIVTVITNTANAGVQSLALRSGLIQRDLVTVPGRTYRLGFAYRNAGNLDGIVSWWPGETNATVTDIADGNTGALVNGATYGTGLVGSALNFDGINDQVLIPDASNLRVTNALTIEMWVNPRNWSGSLRGLLQKWGSVSNTERSYSFDAQANGQGYLIVSADGGVVNLQSVSSTTLIPLNQWTHIAGTYDGTNLRYYVNGNLEATTAWAGGIYAGVAPVSMGAAINGSSIGIHYDGLMDEPTIYNQALTGDQIRDIYLAGAAGKCGMLTPPAVVACSPAQGASIYVTGIVTNSFLGTTSWRQGGLIFTATNTVTTVVVAPLNTNSPSGVFVDSFVLTETPTPRYVLPEESLDVLIGDNPFGTWRLEIWDNRAGAVTFAPTLVDWQLQFVFRTNTPIPGVLLPGDNVTNTIPAGGIRYYVVDVPAWASFATNQLLFASDPVNLLFNQNTPPAIGATNAGDVLLFGPVNTGVYTLTTTNAPLLLPGQRYYLGVHNPGLTPATAVIQVDFDITPLTNDIVVTSTLATGALPRYFYYDVSTNASAVAFSLFGMSGNVDLVARRGSPLPILSSFDYASLNAGIIDDEIVVLTNSSPVALSPGRWYLGVFNRDIVPVTYDIVAREFENQPLIITLTNGIGYANTNSGAGINSDYYRYVVTPDAARVQFDIYGMNANMTLVARKGLPLPNLGLFDAISANSGTNDEIITLFTNTGTVLLTPGSWYLTAVNLSGGPASYTIKATEWAQSVQPDIIGNPFFETNSFCITWNSLPGVRYHVEGKETLTNLTWVKISPTIIATGATTTWCVPLPSPYHFFRVIEQIGTGTGLFGFPAFPGAEGPGAFAVGGRGGSVYYVTNLNDDGPGSLRFGLRAQNRTILFAVSGTITLNSDLHITRSYITIAGQTAPGDGITLRRRAVSVRNNNNVVMRYLRFRSGDTNCPVFQGDSLNFERSQSSIMDHISTSWGIDENLSATESTNVTVQWSLISESLNNSCHLSGLHGYGSLIRYGHGALSYHHNLYSANYSRNPRLGDNITLDFVNNLIYNWGIQAGYSEDDTADNPGGFTNRLNFVGNYLIAGSNTLSPTVAFDGGTTNTWIYQSGNRIDSNLNGNRDGADTGAAMIANLYTPIGVPFGVQPVLTDTADIAYERVLAFSGASFKRDLVDLRLINDVRSQSGNIIDTTAAVGGWPALIGSASPTDADLDGMPNYWETTLGLDPNVPGNNNDRDTDGYTDLEEYLNWLASPHAVCFTNTFVEVDLRPMVGTVGNFGFTVSNGTNGSVTLMPDGYTARFVPATTPFSGRASFLFGFTNITTATFVSPVTVSILVNAQTPAPITPPVIGSVVNLTNGINLTWTSDAGRQFRAQWTTNLASPIIWNTFTNIISSGGTNYSFLDDGAQTGGFGVMRFYRLLNYP